MTRTAALALALLALLPAHDAAADRGDWRRPPDATLLMKRHDMRRLPCRPSDLEARKRGRTLRERYGPYRAFYRGRAVLELDGAYALAATRLRLHVWCDR